MSALVADPVLAVLIDELMARELVRDIAEWTDEEAERARLAAFDLAQRNGPLHHSGALRPWGKYSVVRSWHRDNTSACFAVERFFSSFDPEDFALESPDVSDRAWRERVGSFAEDAE